MEIENVEDTIRVVDMRDATLGEEVAMRMTTEVEQDINGQGWDQYLTICSIIVDPFQTTPDGGALGAISRLELPPFLKENDNPQVLLAYLTTLAHGGVLLDGTSDTEAVVGLVASAEAWSLDKPYDQLTDEDRRYLSEGRLNEHPQRVETRLTMAMMTGIEVQILRWRGAGKDGADRIEFGFGFSDNSMRDFVRVAEDIMTRFPENDRRLARIGELGRGL